MAVKAPTDKRFKRARVKAPKRGARWARVARPAIAIGVLLLIVGYTSARGHALVTQAPGLRITQIAVLGTRQLTPAEVRQRVGSLRGQNIVRADLERARAQLLRSPWVREATLRRLLPGTVEIAIVEREPLGLARFDEALYLVAGDGTLLAAYGPEHAEYDLPIIDGLRARQTRAALAVDESRAALAAQVVHGLRHAKDLSALVSQIDVSNEEDAVVLLAGDPARLHLGQDRFAERLNAYRVLAPALRARVPSIDYVDMRFDSRVFVRPGRTRVR